ncbi:MAG: DUF5667 domain-containing protein [bacterium]|nr:DUF5667 domain-containing protein [bacterium]
MKKLTTLSILFISLAFVVPMQASAATSAGVKPGSFFYFFDTASENISLFFTFNPEQKAKKALEYADERLAEIEAIAEEKNPDAVKTALANYESNVALATEKSKEVKNEGQAKSLLTSIADNASKNQEVLSAVLVKVPEEARAAITQAIEARKKGQEEATKQIAELKGEIEKLKNEVAELKTKETKVETNTQANEVEKLKKEVEALKKQSATQPVPKQPTQTTQNSQEQKKVEEKPKTTIATLPSGAIAEMDANGNIVRIIKEAPVAPKVSDQELESALTKFYIQSNFDFVRSSISSLLNVAYAQRNSYNAVAKSTSISCSQYDSAIENAKIDGQLELTQAGDRGGSFFPSVMQGIKDKTARRIQELTDSKDSCLASTPKVDASLSQEIDNAVSRINSLSARTNSGPSSVSEMTSIVQEYNSIMQLLVSINYSIPSPTSFSSQKISSPGSFSCSSGAGGTGNYSCSDYSSGVSTYCSTSVAGSWSCTNSNAKSVYCRTNAIGNGIDCSY